MQEQDKSQGAMAKKETKRVVMTLTHVEYERLKWRAKAGYRSVPAYLKWLCSRDVGSARGQREKAED